MLSTDSIKGQIFADVTVHDELNASVFQLRDATHHDVFFQLEARNTVGEQTASAVVTIINGDLNALATKHIGSGDSDDCADELDDLLDEYDARSVKKLKDLQVQEFHKELKAIVAKYYDIEDDN